MEAVRERGGMPILYNPMTGNHESEVYYTREEFVNELANQLGQTYGLYDIREAHLIDPQWKAMPMRAWDDVYEDLCREVGSSYGLNDIREA